MHKKRCTVHATRIMKIPSQVNPKTIVQFPQSRGNHKIAVILNLDIFARYTRLFLRAYLRGFSDYIS